MSESFNNRVFGCAIVKAINSSYNADFTGQPRTLPDGRVYATDKAFKYSIRNFIIKFYEGKEKVFYFKRLNDDFNPFDLLGAYKNAFGSDIGKNTTRQEILINLFSCIDVRLFGATFAPKGDDQKGKNISIHGCVQITHAIDRYEQGRIYSEQITAPFADPKSKTDKDTKEVTKTDPNQTTIGNQSMLSEGHYVHHFTVNPKNIEDLIKKAKCQVN